MTNAASKPRIEVIDALRGFAIFSILLLHNLEHFDFYYFPKQIPHWLKIMDGKIWDTMFFLFSGKSYAIFALLFGLTFFIQFNNQQKKGLDFSGRFLWRMFLLLLFGVFNSMFFEGDILAFYAVLGIVLIPVRKLSNKVVLVIAVFLMLQPWEWAKYFYILWHPGYVAPSRMSDFYFAGIGQYLGNGTFWEAVKGNLWNGRLAVIFWSWENGRFFQTASLFMLGMLLGRQGRFNQSAENNKFWIRTLVVSSVSFVVLYTWKQSLHELIVRDALRDRMHLIVGSWSNFAFMLVLVSLFVVIYYRVVSYKILSKLVPFGRMSLSNYIMQSILGSLVYYGFGLGLYKYTGATSCLVIGLCLAILQLLFCRWWLKNHKQGPLEYIWHKATWI
jgi:uncharacterized protein